MRDRLIELISDYTETITARELHSAEFDEKFADHILADGWIRPPCKVGDTIYYPWVYDGTSGIAILEVSSIRLFRQKINLIFYDNVQSDMPMPSGFFFDDFGKTVFLTKEQAEKALERRGE